MTTEHDIAIVGMSCVFPQAADLRTYWANNVNGVDAIIDKPARRWPEHNNWSLPKDHEAYLPTRKAGYLADGLLFDPIRFGVVPNLVKHGDPDQFLMLHVIDQALRDARVPEDAAIRERSDVIIGRGGYATGKLIELALRAELYEDFLEILDRRYPEMFAGRRAEVESYIRSTLTPLSADNVSTAVSNISASRPANRFNLRGAAYVVDGACASSLLAVDSAVWRLRTHQSDLAVAAGMFVNMTPTFFHVFTRLGAVSTQQVIRPFDRRADGLMVGEGGGAIILKRLADAQRDEDQIYAVIKGVGTSSDGMGLDVLAPNPEGQVLAVERAYKDAKVDPALIGYLECHGTGTEAGDAAEVETIKRCFGRSKTLATSRAMGSVKSMIGHTMPAAGMAAIIRTALALSNKILPPTLHCDEPREDLRDAPFYVNTQTRPWIQASTHGPRRAAINSFGFGGINAHVVLEETPNSPPNALVRGYRPRPIEAGLTRETELAAYSGETPEKIVDAIEATISFLDGNVTEVSLAGLCRSLAERTDPKHPVKLAFLCRDLDSFRTTSRKVIDGIRQNAGFESEEDIYYSASALNPPGKIAFVLPGMGFPGLIGNYPDHLLELCMHFPEVREEFDFFEERDRHPDDTVPTSSIFCPPASLPEEYRKQLKGRLAPPKADSDFSKSTAPHERYLAAMGVTLANWVSWILLQRFKIPVDMMTGQSQGEMAALCAAGAADFHESAPSFWKVLDIDTRDQLGGRLAFAWTTGTRLAELTAQYPGTYVAIHMAPTGTIFGGDRDGLEKICDILREEEVLVQVLPYPPIHTPALSHLKEELTAKLEEDEFEIRAPRIPLYSSITSELYPDDPTGIREHVMYNVDRPLKIWQTVQSMYRDGARVFVQVGGGHMSAHLELLLPEGAEKVVTAATDTDTRNPITQLNHLCATLFTAGVPIELRPLFDGREIRLLDLDEPRTEKPKASLQIPLRLDWMPIYSETVPPRRIEEEASTDASAPPAAPEKKEDLAPAAVSEAAAKSGSLNHLLPLDAETIARLPILGDVVSYEPGQSITIVRTLSLETDPYLGDHLFVHAPNKPLLERLPVLPMTMSIEFMAETAWLLAPHLGLIGFENVRAMRWIGLKDQPTEELRIEARVATVDESTGIWRIEAKFHAGGTLSFTATALLGDRYSHDLTFEVADSSADPAWPIQSEQIYDHRYMFHGPAFQVFQRLDTFGNPGASGALAVLPKNQLFPGNPDPILFTDPCLMDGIGQIVGLWTMFNGVFILPTSADKIELYGPIPPVGTLTPIRMECLEINEESRQVRCNVIIEDGQGNDWVRVEAWAEWIMNWSFKYEEATRMPSWYLLGDEMPLPGLPDDAVAMQIDKGSIAGADPEWVARIFLHSDELHEYYEKPDLKAKRELLRHRCAIKEAVRCWWSRRYQTEYPHPSEFLVSHDASGAPHLEPADNTHLPHVTLTHSGDVAMAIASASPMGIDIEPESRDTWSIADQFMTESEQSQARVLDDSMPDEAWPTRFWCGKEAVSKLLKTGLQGRPKQYEVVDIQPDGTLFVEHRADQSRYECRTLRWNGWIIAYASHAVESANVV